MTNIENGDFLTKQILTYLGNKRTLLQFVGTAVDIVKSELGRDKLVIGDAFSGSGIVSRYFKASAKTLIVNDIETYAEVLNKCYLTNRCDVPEQRLKDAFSYLNSVVNKPLKMGFISEMYAPKNENAIELGERVFYTARNAAYIDTLRMGIDCIDEELRNYFLAPLLVEASIKSNTSGVFKGFYKNSNTGIGQYGGNGENALSRIKSNITLQMPIFSNFECDVEIYKNDANQLMPNIRNMDLLYIDPPYNEHPYGSNYFMLNLIAEYKKPSEVSCVSGIPKDWQRSDYNKEKKATLALKDLCENVDAKYIAISFNSDGFISKDDMEKMLSGIGNVRVFEQKYNTFRGSRNLKDREIHTKEYLYLVKKYRMAMVF